MRLTTSSLSTKTKRKLSPGDQIRAVAVAGRQLDAIVFERVHEGLRALIAPKDESAAICVVVVPNRGLAMTVLPRHCGSA